MLWPGRDKTPLERRIGTQVGASPAAVRHDPDGAEPDWYKPDFAETARLMGWRWLFIVPAVGVVASLVLIPTHPQLIQLVFASWKLALPLVALPFVAFVGAASHAIRSRKDPFCIHCGYGLTGLPDGHNCPECGRPFSLSVVDEYRRDPDWFVRRWREHQRLPARATPFQAGAVRRRKSRDGT